VAAKLAVLSVEAGIYAIVAAGKAHVEILRQLCQQLRNE
jgi:hypothetical protein